MIAPKDRAVGLTDVAAKTACGAAETVPYVMVTNLARTLGELKERDILCVGTSDQAEQSIYQTPLVGNHAGLAWVLVALGLSLWAGARPAAKRFRRQARAHAGRPGPCPWSGWSPRRSPLR